MTRVLAFLGLLTALSVGQVRADDTSPAVPPDTPAAAMPAAAAPAAVQAGEAVAFCVLSLKNAPVVWLARPKFVPGPA